MNKLTKKARIDICVVGVLALLLVLFAFFDLKISNALFDKGSEFGWFFREIGEIPMFLIVPLFVVSAIFVTNIKAVKIVCMCILPFSNYLWLDRLFRLFNFSKGQYIAAMIVGMLCSYSLLIFLFSRISKKNIKRLFRIFLVGIIFAILTLLAVHFTKILWGRVRFINLKDNFTKWYVINGNNGNKSFPSGHTSSACGLYIIMLICKEFRPKIPLQILLYMFMIGFILATALSRIVLGAHYASDVTFALLLCYLFYNLSLFAVNKLFQQKQAKTPQNNSPESTESKAESVHSKTESTENKTESETKTEIV